MILFTNMHDCCGLQTRETRGSVNSTIGSRSVRVFTGSDLITGSDRIGPDRARNMLFSSFLKHFFIIIMFIKNVYDHNNDVWIIKVGDDSYYLTGSGPKMV